MTPRINEGIEAICDDLLGRDEETQIAYDRLRAIGKLISEDLPEHISGGNDEYIGIEYSLKTASSINNKISRVKYQESLRRIASRARKI